MYLRQQWSDPRLMFNVTENNNSSRLKMYDGAWKDIWVPDVYFRNEKRAITHDITSANRMLRVNNNGVVWYVMK
jgi:gamma-aminobutyric acid receptor subunit alpha